MRIRKILLAILLIIAALPVVFYGAWHFYSYKFQKNLIEQIRKSLSFHYKDCKTSGFPSASVTLTFSDPVLYLGNDINKAVLKFDSLEFTKRFNEDVVSVHNDKPIKAKINGERLILDGIKDAKIFLSPDMEDYIRMTVNQPGFKLYNDDGDVDNFGDLDFRIEAELGKRIDFSISIVKDGVRVIEQEIELKWDKYETQSDYDLNVKKMILDRGKEYKITAEGRVKLGFSYKYSVDGAILLFVENYEGFLQSMSKNGKHEDSEKFRQFLLDNAEIDGKNLRIKLHGDGEQSFIGKKSIDELILSAIQN